MAGAKLLLGLVSWLLLTVASASHLTPPVVPLVVRNPYLHVWLANAREEPWSKWPIFWTGQEVGLSMMAYVPESKTTYPLLGRPQDSLSKGDENGYKLSYPQYEGVSFDATTTNLTYSIPASSSLRQPLNLTLSFLSPITPRSTVRQSIPASYISVTATGHTDVEIYIDVNGHWVSGNRDRTVTWDLEELQSAKSPQLKSWKLRRASEEHFTEFGDRAEWGTLHLTGSSNTTHQAGESAIVRSTFASRGSLSNDIDAGFRHIMDREPVVALHQSLSLNSRNHSRTDQILFTIAHTQREIVQFASERGLTLMRPLWASVFLTEPELISFHYRDYKRAAGQAVKFSAKLAKDAASAASADYVDIVALSARQVLGATSFSGTPQAPLIFLKEISSNGNTQTVDVIFPSFPFFLYTNPRWLAYLLEPLLEHQLSGQYPNKYSMHDLGAHFPNLTGHADGNDEYMPVEECGDMLIMGLALVNSMRDYAKDTLSSIWPSLSKGDPQHKDDTLYHFSLERGNGDEGDEYDESWAVGSSSEGQAKEWVQRSYRIWEQWTKYLIESSLEPANQLSTDDFAGWLPLQTNLALKGIIGIKAMSELSKVLGKDKDVAYYKNISDTYIDKWRVYGMTRDSSHAKLSYDWFGSWTTLYSLFADALLCFHPSSLPSASSSDMPDKVVQPDSNPQQSPLKSPSKGKKPDPNFIPSELYANQSRWYEQVMQKFGLPLDSRHLYTKSDWELEVAAVASPKVKRDIISRLARWLNETETNLPFSDLHDTEGPGGFAAGNRFTARPVVGGHFSLLALERACGGMALDGLQFWPDEDL